MLPSPPHASSGCLTSAGRTLFRVRRERRRHAGRRIVPTSDRRAGRDGRRSADSCGRPGWRDAGPVRRVDVLERKSRRLSGGDYEDAKRHVACVSGDGPRRRAFPSGGHHQSRHGRWPSTRSSRLRHRDRKGIRQPWRVPDALPRARTGQQPRRLGTHRSRPVRCECHAGAECARRFTASCGRRPARGGDERPRSLSERPGGGRRHRIERHVEQRDRSYPAVSRGSSARRWKRWRRRLPRRSLERFTFPSWAFASCPTTSPTTVPTTAERRQPARLTSSTS